MNARQSAFVNEYLFDLNATQAAIRAGYSAKTAYSQGERLLKNAEVAAAVSAAQAERSQRTRINADWVLSRLGAEVEADLADLYREDGSVKPVHEWPLIWRQGLVAGVEVERLAEGIGTVTKIKISDRIKRIDLIGKHIDVQAFKEKVEHTGGITIVIDKDDLTA
jgi:phage terminase small subunit